MILGNSLDTIPKFCNDNPNKKFDFIFIDGGHDYVTAKKDIINCRNLAAKKNIVFMDDTIFTPGWTQGCGYTDGPTLAWKEAISEKLVKPISSKDFIGPKNPRGMSWGNYIV